LKTITLEMSDKAYRKINTILALKKMNDGAETLDLAWFKVIRHMDENKPVVTLQTPEDKTTKKF